MSIYTTLCCLVIAVFTSVHSAQAAHHGADKAHLWTLVPEESKVAYASIKKEQVGEVNHFKSIEGGIAADGQVNVDIDLSSVETYIDIRNKRMIEHVFGRSTANATLQAKVDLNVVNQLAVGSSTIVDVEGNLSFLDKQIPIEASFFLVKITNKKVLVVTDEMIMVKTETLGINKGVDQLMSLAKLPSITRVVPVSLRMVFQSGKDLAALSPSSSLSAAVVQADIKAGKQLFKQCQACHQATKTMNTVGPHLVNIVGRAAGKVDGFGYSAAMQSSSLVWTEENLKQFIANPAKLIPGTSMFFPGINDPQAIDNLLAYLKSLDS